jgi:hypothetical protein
MQAPNAPEIFKWLQDTSVGSHISDSLWLFPFIESLHVWGIVVLVSATGILDLRLLGLALKETSVSKLNNKLLHWAWCGFAVMVITGLLLFSSEATKLYNNGAFLLKMCLILLAGINALVFHTTIYQRVDKWDVAAVTPIGAKLAGAFSLVLWVGVIFAGRWIAYW